MGILYLVPTPIGNLEDITLRALRILRESTLIAAEDTRVTGRLLSHYQITTPLISYHEHNKLTRVPTILAAVRQGDVALVSDAGVPGISDPGHELICAAIEEGLTITPLPGPSASLTAAVASGLPLNNFLYLGFLPRKASQRRSVLREISELPYTLVIYESPHRLQVMLEDALEMLGDRKVLIGRELTKLYEELWRGTLEVASHHFREFLPRGEITLVIEGNTQDGTRKWEKSSIVEELAKMRMAGLSRAHAARMLAAKSEWPRRELYDLWDDE